MRWGLLLFFVLSGFLLYRPWLAATESSGRPDLWRYLRSRAARILPAYYLALAAAMLLLSGSGAVPGVRLPGDDTMPLFLVFAQNFSRDSLLTLDPPMWTLAVEVSYYAVLPVLGLAALRLGRRRRTLLATSAAKQTAAYCPRALSWTPLARVGTVSYGLYLWHVPVHWWLRGRGLLPLDPLPALPVVLAPSLLLAALSWAWIERPAIAWARRAPAADRWARAPRATAA